MDAINKPAHYNQGTIECIDAMQQILTPEEFRGFLKGNVFKYLWREKGKNGIEDLRKGKDYYDRLIQSFDESEDQPVIKQSSTTEPPDGWRFLEVGEVIRKGDQGFEKNLFHAIEPIKIGMTLQAHWMPTIRRNKFEVGEKVVYTIDNTIWTFKSEIDDGLRFPKSAWVTSLTGIGKMSQRICVSHLAPYIEETKPTVEVAVEVTGEVKNPLGCPDGWRWLEVGEVIRKGDRCFTNHSGSIDCLTSVGEKFNHESHYPTIRRNKFEVGEKVVRVSEPRGIVFQVKCAFLDNSYGLATEVGMVDRLHAKDLAPCIEETK